MSAVPTLIRRIPREAQVAAWVALFAIVIGLSAAPPWRSAERVAEGFGARLLSGDLQRLHGGRWTAVDTGSLLPETATVRSARGAELAVIGGRVTLAPQSEAVLDDALELSTGSVLVEVPDREVGVALDALEAAGRGAWRVDAGDDGRVGVYHGGVAVKGSGGDGVPLGRFEQVKVVAGRVASGPLPLRYRAADPWDTRLLAGAFAVDREAERLWRSLSAAYGEAPRPASFYAAFSAVDAEMIGVLPRFGIPGPSGTVGPPATVLLHVVVTELLTDQAGLEVRAAADEVSTLRADGGSWGVVLGRHDLGADHFVAAIDRALKRSEVAGLAPAAEPTPTRASGAGRLPATPSAPRPSREVATPPTRQPRQGAAPKPAPSPPPSPCDDCPGTDGPVGDLTGIIGDVASEVPDTTENVVGDLTGILRGTP